jgi:glycine betaine/choline ABC-type transport system substrate-binding protein
MINIKKIIPLFFILIPVLFPCSCGSPKKIAVGASTAEGTVIIGELYAQALESASYRVTRDYDSVNTLRQSLLRGEIDLYPAYPPFEVDGVVPLDSIPANSAWALAVLRETSEKRELSTLEDLRAAAGELILASTGEFRDDPQGFRRLTEVYGPFEFKNSVAATADNLHMPFHMGEVDVIPLRRDDGHLADPMHRLLEDNLHALNPRHITPLLRKGYSEEEEVREIVNRVSASLTNGELIELNNRIFVQGIPSPAVARDYLKSRKFIK